MLKVIENETEYLEALKQIEELIELDPKEGTAEAHKLDLLVLLIKDYESTRYFVEPTLDPVDAIQFRMEQEDLKPRDLIQYIGSRSKVSEVLSRKRPLSISMIRALHEGLGIPLKSLVSETIDGENTHGNDWERYPVKEMIKRNWINVENVNSDTEFSKTIMNFIKQVGNPEELIAYHRKTNHIRTARKIDKYALIAWTARIISLAKDLKIKTTYDSRNLDKDYIKRLVKLSIKGSAPALVQETLKEIGIAFVIEPPLARTHLDGVALVHSQIPIIGMTLRYDRIDYFWYTLIHEIAHLHLHLNNSDISFYDDLDLHESTDQLETEADNFTGEILIPDEEWTNSPASKLRTPEAAQHLANKLKIHPAIVAGRMRFVFRNYKILNNLVGHNQVRKCFPEKNWRK